MQQIILTQEDADWVSNVIRDKLEVLEDSYKAALKGNNDAYKYIEELIHRVFPGDVSYKKTLYDLFEYSNEKKREETSLYEKRKREYYKILELMMVGSNV